MKKFFHKIVSFLHVLFTNLDVWVHVHIQPSIDVVQKIKSFVDGNFADVLTHLIPGDTDDKVRNWISTHLPKAINVMQVTSAITNEADFVKKLDLLFAYLRTLSPVVRAGYYLTLASEIAKSSGNEDKVKGHSVNLLTQLQYSKQREDVSHSDLPPTKYCTPVTENTTNDAGTETPPYIGDTPPNVPPTEESLTTLSDEENRAINGHRTEWYK